MIVRIKYCYYGIAVSDFDVEDFVTDIKAMIVENNPYLERREILVSSAIAIEAILTEISFERLRHQDIIFAYIHDGNEVEIRPNEYGMIPGWPNGFCDKSMRMAEARLVNSMRRRKNKRETSHNNPETDPKP